MRKDEKPWTEKFAGQKILKEIQGSESPVSGTQLARNFEVSRQVIVQDIAVLGLPEMRSFPPAGDTSAREATEPAESSG